MITFIVSGCPSRKKRDLEKRLQSYGVTLEEAIPNYLQAVMDREDKNT
jgi:hypothetical protein